jgi:hypothetical protein
MATANSSPKVLAALDAIIPSEVYVIFSGIELPPALFWVCFCLSTSAFSMSAILIGTSHYIPRSFSCSLRISSL